MEELTLTMEQALILIAVLIPLNLILWFCVGLGTYQAHSKPKKYTRHLENERYGAYIQLAGKRYN
ncbi:TPA: hypothetical protein U1667_000169 [Streptococcus suis]|uniref:Phage membrane protein n=1 Tax=Streptococcus suis TaxID=1307 RepID=A0AB37G3S4_STRSU|nr:hypothetical protein [Streptococcus suis]MCB2913693.1 hypothetical protein [Streptococcus suis]MCB2919511.1 hypothetical protein [Streptococcus suis]MCQ8268944.1 hypothetical protein [Streptococcus suis]MDW8659092.1 hypothetical protein [Streptococcus suis]MDW8733652.1 hypothetical protein [Streptococcus suis]